MDPLRHPDLVELTRRLRSQFEVVRDAEREAASIAYRRSRSLRDRFLDAEDREEQATIVTVAGSVLTGVVTGVGLDHVIVAGSVISLLHITTAEFQ